jgi:hypothetical protein
MQYNYIIKGGAMSTLRELIEKHGHANGLLEWHLQNASPSSEIDYMSNSERRSIYRKHIERMSADELLDEISQIYESETSEA